ncbi:MAG: hypothetical protein JXR77_06530, partial [Lentisphaeria bacterium]|nr:hypothetical protein [Lentisphaeria bacterium]
HVQQNPAWRSTWPNGVWLSSQPLGDGHFTLEGVDPSDNLLNDSVYEPLVLTGTGAVGPARHKTRVTLVPVVEPLEALNTCLHGSGLITVAQGARITVVGAPLSSNGSLVNNGTVDGSVEVQSIHPVGTTGPRTVPAPSKALPDAAVITYYASKGTPIPFTGNIDNYALGPGCNPWSAVTDPNGLYVLNTGGNAVTIQNTRIFGTLVILAPNKTVTLDGAVHFQNYRSDFPVLIVQGNLVINCSSANTPLSEVANAKNYNPAGAPYEGTYDDDALDVYPNEIRGLVHVQGTLNLQSTSRIVGAVLCNGAVTLSGVTTIVHNPALYACPPDGYTFVSGMQISPNSWHQTVD